MVFGLVDCCIVALAVLVDGNISLPSELEALCCYYLLIRSCHGMGRSAVVLFALWGTVDRRPLNSPP